MKESIPLNLDARLAIVNRRLQGISKNIEEAINNREIGQLRINLAGLGREGTSLGWLLFQRGFRDDNREDVAAGFLQMTLSHLAMFTVLPPALIAIGIEKIRERT